MNLFNLSETAIKYINKCILLDVVIPAYPPGHKWIAGTQEPGMASMPLGCRHSLAA